MAKKTQFRWNTRDLQQAVQRELRRVPEKAKRAMDGVGGYINGEVRKRTPVDEGHLTASITNETVEYRKSSATVIYVPSNAPSAEYAIATHENDYNIGADSQKKQQKTGKKVGKKYITRALDENRDRIVKIIKKEMEV
jgi:hypothetical protein